MINFDLITYLKFSINSFNVGDEVSVEVIAPHVMHELNSVVIGPKGIVRNDTYSVSNSQSFNLKFIATDDMKPKSSLIVYYVDQTSDVIYGETTLQMSPQDSDNFVSAFLRIT
jgi:Alpha-2-macroglobulin bait region domain